MYPSGANGQTVLTEILLSPGVQVRDLTGSLGHGGVTGKHVPG